MTARPWLDYHRRDLQQIRRTLARLAEHESAAGREPVEQLLAGFDAGRRPAPTDRPLVAITEDARLSHLLERWLADGRMRDAWMAAGTWDDAVEAEWRRDEDELRAAGLLVAEAAGRAA